MDTHDFEREVRRLAHLRWPLAAAGGTEVIDGRERDGVFITEDCMHLLECTVSRRKDKARSDLEKLFGIYKKFRSKYPDRAVKCWFITLEEPTPDQRACRTEIKGAPEFLFNVISFAQFQAALVDVRSYLNLRSRHKFGSIYDPRTLNATEDVPYIEVGLRVHGEASGCTVDLLAQRLLKGERFTLLGEYGIGKSMTLREIYRRLVDLHRQGKTLLFPLYINLREHQGQREPAEILERHARNVGFDPPSQLVRAWKAGYAVLLLDGFDEVSSAGLQGAWRRLREARSASMAGVRQLISDGPHSCGIAIAGREHFFDTPEERKKAIGQVGLWRDVRLDEFGEKQIAALMAQFGIRETVPAWFPTRPLLLSTLFAGTLRTGGQVDWSAMSDPASGWDFLLNEVSERESRIESGVSGANIRGIIEALATVARRKDGGLGPILTADIINAFQTECGFAPTDEALIVLQRLPGLGRDSSIAEDARNFVDRDFADACRAGELVKFCVEPFGPYGERLAGTRVTLGEVGTAVAGQLLMRAGFNSGRMRAAVQAMERLGDRGAIPADLFLIANETRQQADASVHVHGFSFGRIVLDHGDVDLSSYRLSECYIESLEMTPDLANLHCPSFHDCLIPLIEGRAGELDLPSGRFTDCTIEAFADNAMTTQAALNLSLPAGSRIALTVLKKLFAQSGKGRMESALFRGLAPELRPKVPAVITILATHGLITKSTRGGEPIWLPVRQARDRALSILAAPNGTNDPAIAEARTI